MKNLTISQVRTLLDKAANVVNRYHASVNNHVTVIANTEITGYLIGVWFDKSKVSLIVMTINKRKIKLVEVDPDEIQNVSIASPSSLGPNDIKLLIDLEKYAIDLGKVWVYKKN